VLVLWCDKIGKQIGLIETKKKNVEFMIKFVFRSRQKWLHGF